MAAWCYVLSKNYGWSSDDTKETAELERLARQAARLAKEDAVALYTGGFAPTRVPGQLGAATALIDRALALDPNLAAAWHLNGWVKLYRGEPEAAIEHLAQAIASTARPDVLWHAKWNRRRAFPRRPIRRRCLLGRNGAESTR